jgi:diaminopimelate decarboxylase
MPGLDVIGIDCHIGSQLLDTAPLLEALDHLLALLDQLESDGMRIRHLDMGGGLGVSYGAEQAPAIDRYLRSLVEGIGERDVTLVLEPGRSIVANAGALLTSVQYLKPASEKNFALVDAAMNDLLRPALYGAWQDIVPVEARPGPLQCWDVVGPVCETGDFLGKSRELCLASGDVLAVLGAGAYGFVMASNYNSRPRPAEVMIDGAAIHTVRQRETLTDLWALETVLPD